MRMRTIALLAGAAAFWSPAFAVERSWSAGNNGTFSVAGNWLGGVVPGSGDIAVFDLGDPGYTVTLSGNVSNVGLSVRNDTTTFDLNGFTFTTLSSGFTSGGLNDISRLTLTSGTLSIPGTNTIGSAAGLRQTLTVSTGATVTSTSTGTLNVGDAGEGTLAVINGGTVNAVTIEMSRFNGAGGTGTLTVSGLNSSVTATNVIEVGGAGHGVLTISGGARVTTGNLFDAASGASSGSITVTGSQSTLTTTDNLSVGFASVAVMRVDQGGFVTSGSAIINNGSSVTLDGQDSGWNTGTINLITGSLIISNAANVDSTTVTLGGSATVTGTGARWTGNTFFVNGELDVVTGGTCSATNATVGSFASSTGSMHVVGPEANFALSGTFDIGLNGNGALVAEDRATVSLGTVTLGTGSTGFGTVTVRDPGTNCSSGTLNVGGSGTGVLEVENAGLASIGTSANVGVNAGGRGTIHIAGFGSRLTASSMTLSQGASSSSTILIEEGGILSLGTGTLTIAPATTAGANVTVTGPGSQLSVGHLYLGGTSITSGGASSLLVAAGGAVTCSSEVMQVWTGSTLTLDSASVNNTLGTNNTGQIQLTGTNPQLTGGALTNAAGGLVSGSGRITSSLTNASGATIRASGTDWLRFTGASNTNNGQISLLNGAQLDFTNGMTNGATGLIFGRGVFSTGGLTNNGQILLSAGFSDVFGSLTNTSGSKVIVTGGSTSTFYNNVTNNGGSEFRVGTASTAVFFGSVSGLAQFTGPGTKDFEGPTSLGGIASAGNTIAGPSSTVTADFIRDSSLVVFGTLTINTNGTSAGTSRLNSLSIMTPGRFDLRDNDLVIDYAGTSPLSTILGYLQTGYAGGAWTGNGLTSSSAAAVAANASNTHKTALGFAEASSLGVASFSGQSVDSTALLVRYTLSGDANVDGTVNSLDFTALASHFGAVGQFWFNGDFNYDGIVNALDFNAISTNFGAILPSAPAGPGTLVPDPIASLPVAMVIGLRRRGGASGNARKKEPRPSIEDRGSV